MPAHLVLLGRTLTPTHRPGRQSGADRARARRGRVAERRVAACGRDGRPRPSCSAGLAAALLASLVWAARADAVHAGALSWVNADRPRLVRVGRCDSAWACSPSPAARGHSRWCACQLLSWYDSSNACVSPLSD